MIRVKFSHLALAVAMAGAGLLAGCAAKAPPPPPPPPPPVAIVIPPRPTPPHGAAEGLFVPPLGADGIRQTVNAHLTPAQTVWNLRSAYNVAALYCLRPDEADILVGYKAFLKTHGKALVAANRTVDTEFQGRFGKAYIAPREAYMTQVYNYFALPTTREEFCSAALTMARESTLVKKGELDAFAARALPQLEAVYEAFYRDYDSYRLSLANWQALYGPKPVPAPADGPATAVAVTLPVPATAPGVAGPADTPKR